MIQVTQQGEPDGWWEGALNGQVGWFPSNYCAPYNTQQLLVPYNTQQQYGAQATRGRSLPAVSQVSGWVLGWV